MLSDEMQYAIAIAQIVSSAAVSLGVIIAAITIVYNVKTARKVHTSVFLGESRFDVDYKKGLSTMRRIHESNKAFRSYMYPSNGQADLTDEEKLEKREIIYCLGFYERMAVSVKRKTYDETMVKEVFYSSVVNNYEISLPLIKAIREKENNSTYFKEYEWMAKRWKKCPLKNK
ncbi:DUF4760 domain-containing protein [Klebsiella pneumoniae]|uniref:DUF4760 domain-containing protein n=1 Tax=Klebsiella pneumoniae TaxID=573 RepID=UPI0007422088|nr:DUF4760 domain-containing protein [Klebsiella pneumoniae]HBW1557636.1 DUF4760 domain-containing protein [Klebsiella quasipneumoniae subsp. similipneumoniae]EKV6348804.1 DUF4760 domain-containing protein [Klebsiella pneumoniae]EKZ5683310.1 DUF4760 domain-containing protein [Klebsiella pneumoniae]ELB4056648.1 DUF4760 domain-containing protein [Klebsiella pneumoniae]KSY12959.1 hypothetical protein APU00_02085 [Klebsiella pneumoniae]